MRVKVKKVESAGCSVMSNSGIFQARILDGLPFAFPGDFPNPGIEPWYLALKAHYLLTETPGKSQGD